MTKLAPQIIPMHWGQQDDRDLERWQPKAIKVVDPDPGRLRFWYRLCPNSLYVLRDWAQSEQKSDMLGDPEGTGRRHAEEWQRKLAEWNLPIPHHQLAVEGVNEAAVWESGGIDATVRYYTAFVDACTDFGMRAVALNLGVGWPANTGPDTPPDWGPYEPVRDAILRGDSWLGLHEYFDHNGPEHFWGWWAGRYTQCPWQVPILITECGLDEYVSNPGVEIPARGWRGQVSADEYLAQLAWYDARLQEDSRIYAGTIFTWDFAGNEWWPFDISEDIAPRLPVNHDFAEPDIDGDTGSPPQPPVSNNFNRAVAFVLAHEGGFQNHRDDTGNWTGCELGRGELKGTKYGISACSYPHLDIVNLTEDQAIDIYRRDYWQASGADELPWPACLLLLDTAILHGVGIAQRWMRETGGDPLLLAAKRLRSYTDSSNWSVFGAGWVRRVAALLREAS